MSKSKPSKVFLFDNSDPEMQQAYENARANFRYFWREVAWERRRIVPALDVACVKAPFSDGEGKARNDGNPDVEQMWLGEVDFDGRFVSGVLLNSPNWVKSVKAGDSARLSLDEITDWMYVIGGEVYGAHTVNLMRSRMDKRERKEHDSAWGIDFGYPNTIRVVPPKKNWFGMRVAEIQEHPMSVAMAPSFKSELKADPSLVNTKDDRGWTLLHHQALAGSAPTVKVLLDAGADPNARTGSRHDADTTRQVPRLGQSGCALGGQMGEGISDSPYWYFGAIEPPRFVASANSRETPPASCLTWRILNSVTGPSEHFSKHLRLSNRTSRCHNRPCRIPASDRESLQTSQTGHWSVVGSNPTSSARSTFAGGPSGGGNRS